MSAWKWVLAAVVVAGAAIGVVLWLQSAPETPGQEAAAKQASAEPAPQHYPLPEPEPTQQAPEPLPQLDGSDDAVHAALSDSLGKTPVESFLVPKEFVRR